MLGISTSIFNQAGGLVKDWLKNPLNASFVYWYFLPAAGFAILQLIFVGPSLGYPIPKVFTGEIPANQGSISLTEYLSSGIFMLIVLPLIVGMVLSVLSGSILQFYQGTYSLIRPFTRPWLKRNQDRSSEMYGPLQAKRREYLFLVSQGVHLVTENGEEHATIVSETERATLADQMKAEIQTLHEQLEATSTARYLPADVERVGATDLANTLAVAEEYPIERYSMDTAVFWPRLCAEMDPDSVDSVTTSFGAMNGLLNVSLLSYLFALECLIVLVGRAGGWISVAATALRLRWLIFAAALSIVIGVGAYRAAVRAAASVGDALRTSFDYFRGRILYRFNLKMPDDIDQERVVWLKLAAFIRRGESFYYPSEFRCEDNGSRLFPIGYGDRRQ